MGKRSLTVLELIITICLIFVLMGTFAFYAKFTLKAARETALRSELINLRMSIEYYRIIKGGFPDDLPAILKQHLTTAQPNNTISYNYSFMPFHLDRQGNLLDPFLNRYAYDKGNGTVYSQTQGYERW
ncbi:MAG: hypothetical protein MUC39_02935 [Candidatus Omnitrophica bacterium]|jgi:hypothetical protein|nr:hypothetical protein [Candidatus Omnitrophota bacterium]